MMNWLLEMPNFYVTFGQRFRRQPHPASDNIHPDGYVKIEAVTYAVARAKAMELFGPMWAFIYEEEKFEKCKHYFPRGEIKL